MNPLRYLLAVLLLGVGVWAAGTPTLAWVLFDASSGQYRLSDGTGFQNTAQLASGQFVALQNNQILALEQWRSPSDIEKRWNSHIGRVNFSHERHFGALQSKNCLACHASELGLGSQDPLPSRVDTALEVHGERSLGRFCSTCHNGNTRADVAGGQPKPNLLVFAASKANAAGCNQCHAPASHGADFTATHKSMVSAQGIQTCTTCHRGGNSISLEALAQAKTFVAAQQTLAKNPQDQSAFAKTLPNQFCVYCHATQKNFFTLK